MSLIELMKRDGLRVTNGDRWLTVDEFGMFAVFHRPLRARETKTVIETNDETKAVAELSKGNP